MPVSTTHLLAVRSNHGNQSWNGDRVSTIVEAPTRALCVARLVDLRLRSTGCLCIVAGTTSLRCNAGREN